MPVQCRTCAAIIYNPNTQNIFDKEDNEILLNIEILTGKRLKEDKLMPKHICSCCHLDLYYSIAFRERCLKTENYLQQQKLTPPNPKRKKNVEREVRAENANSTNSSLHSNSKQNDGTPSKNYAALSYMENSPCSSVADNTEDTQRSSAEELNESSASSASESESESEQSLTTPETLEKSASKTPKKTAKQKDIPKSAAVNPKVFICDLCGHQTRSSKNLDIHILRHKGEKNFECEECGSRYYTKYLLDLHIRVKHKGEKPYACKFCGQRFYSGTTRLRHENVRHIREFKYECKTCGKKYITKSCLNKHEFQHTGLRPYRCDLCNVAFPRRPGLKIHCRTKQHQMRASEALNNQLKGITTTVDTLENVDDLNKAEETLC